eukprot:7131436-Pyramimonas_sp.AAC.1
MRTAALFLFPPRTRRRVSSLRLFLSPGFLAVVSALGRGIQRLFSAPRVGTTGTKARPFTHF